MDIDLLCYDVTKIGWSSNMQYESVNDKIELFNDQLKKMYDIHALIKPAQMKRLPASWLTEKLKLLIKKQTAQTPSCE